MRAEFHPAVEHWLVAAVSLGDERGAGPGAELLAEAQRVASLPCNSPQIGESMDALRRRLPLRRYPFGLIYRVDVDAIYTVAVVHRRQLS